MYRLLYVYVQKIYLVFYFIKVKCIRKYFKFDKKEGQSINILMYFFFVNVLKIDFF